MIRLGHDPRGIRGHLHVRAKGMVLEGHDLADARPCPNCRLVTAEPDDPADKHQHAVTCRACGTTQTHLLRALPCTNCSPQGDLTTSLGPGQKLAVARMADGSPYFMGSVQGVKWPWRYRCSACKMTTLISATEFNRLRLMEPAEYLPLLP